MSSQPNLAMIADLESILGYVFTDKSLCWEAQQIHGNGISHVGNRHVGRGGSKALAILGNALATQVLCEEWYNSRHDTGINLTSLGPLQRYRLTEQSVNLTQALTGLMFITNLAAEGNKIGLFRYLNQHSRSYIPSSTLIVATAVQAVIAAVYIDSGKDIEKVRQVMHHLGLSYDAYLRSRREQQVVMFRDFFSALFLNGSMLANVNLCFVRGYGRPPDASRRRSKGVHVSELMKLYSKRSDDCQYFVRPLCKKRLLLRYIWHHWSAFERHWGVFHRFEIA